MPTIQSQSSPATLLWDHQDLIPLQKNLGDEDLVLLLTPAAVPLDQSLANASDPFEPLGKALARAHSWIRHVPYTKERGITGIHVAFIKRARVVIFVLTGFPTEEGLFQLELAEVAREVCEERPLVLVACCEVSEKGARECGFPTIIQCPEYFAADLQAVAVLLTSERPTIEATPPTGNSPPPPTWSLLKWDYDRDLPETHALWEACLPPKFHLNRSTLGSLLKRDGYAMHYMVREPNQGKAIGFCATFTTFTDSSGDRLIGSVAAIIVHKDFRGQGVGHFLHDEAVIKLSKIRGVGIIQLGSTFPRLLYGLPVPETNTEWFERRGWNMKESTPGNGRRVLDWLLRFADHPVPDLASAGLTFRPCQLTDYQKVVEMANKESQKRYRFGWSDQYAKTMDSCYMNDIVVGLEGENLVAAAITYFPNNGSPCGADIPWPASIGQSIGGVSCICIKDEDPNMVNRRDSVVTRLLLACRQTLSEREMVGMFIDGSRSDENVLQSLGFCKWAEYKELWRKV
ncbi:beta-n-acetylglucosaminidase [Fusarium coicis]|nr:beta-n-acetylglucosaminidase [Fusarium coicis]